jgi:hypothetical protein
MGEGEPENEVDSSFKNYFFMGHGRLDFVLGSYSIPVIDFPPITQVPAQYSRIPLTQAWKH